MNMKYIVYSKKDCPWCERAKEILKKNGYEYEELMYGEDYTKEELATKLGITDRVTVPQIFLGSAYLGNYEALRDLINDSEGEK